MTPREQAALKAEAALSEFLYIGRQAGSLWPEEERALRAALNIVRKNTGKPRAL